MTTKHLTVRLALSLICLLTFPAAPIGARGGRAAARVGRPASRAALPAVQKAFRPYGYFSLVGKRPRWLENFDTIQYWRKDQEQTGEDISQRTAGVNETGGVVYAYATISLTRRTFVFTTKAVGGVSYKFSGRFLRTDFVGSETEFEHPVLTGTLGKYRNGKRVAGAHVKLSYFAGT
jgi:hypothetical protein